MPDLPPVKKFLSNTGVRSYQIPCQVFETLSARVYLLLGAGPPTLVDAGSSLKSSVAQILAGVETVRSEFGEAVCPADIRRILISHGHIDHIGGLPELLRHMPAEVAVHPLDRRAIVAPREHTVVGFSRLDAFLQRAGVDTARRVNLLKISPYSGRLAEGVPVGRTLEDGEELDGLRIIHTPGHSPGHVCIGVGNVLLSADHVLSRTLPHQWVESATAYTGLGHYLESLDKVQRMAGFEIALAAHEQVIHDVSRRIDAIAATHQRRLERVLELVRAASGPMTLYEIVLQSYPELTGFRAVLAFTDIGSRVEYLHQRGQLTVANLDEVERDENPVYRYVVA
jgi:glyoxylase-like metal-dependent hydrolase (beta-lactamase superfamily II)